MNQGGHVEEEGEEGGRWKKRGGRQMRNTGGSASKTASTILFKTSYIKRSCISYLQSTMPE